MESGVAARGSVKIKVLLVDDHAVLRESMRNLLQHQKNIKVIGEAGDGEEAIKLVSRYNRVIILPFF